MVLAATIRGGKAQKNGEPGYGGCFRNKDVLRCAHGAIARWMARRYTIDKVWIGNASAADKLLAVDKPQLCYGFAHLNFTLR